MVQRNRYLLYLLRLCGQTWVLKKTIIRVKTLYRDQKRWHNSIFVEL